MIFCIVGLLTACGHAKQQSDIRKYTLEIDGLNQKQKKIHTLYEQHVLKENDSTKAFDVLTNQVIPEYQALVKEVKTIKSTDQKITTIHTSYQKAVVLRLQTYKQYREALRTKNTALLQQATANNETIKQLISSHEKELLSYAKQYDIEIKTR